MKRYKLLKWYPALPVEYNRSDDDMKYSFYKGKHICPNGYTITESEAKSNPEFWEEVISKDYEILSFISKGCSNIVELRDDGYYHYTYVKRYISTLTEDKALARDYWKIYSVRRLSDGEVFTVGDKVIWDWSRANVEYFTIKEFKKPNNLLYIDTVEDSNQGFDFKLLSTYNLRHYKEVLFVTDDGYEVTDPDETIHHAEKEVLSTGLVMLTPYSDYAKNIDLEKAIYTVKDPNQISSMIESENEKYFRKNRK